MGLLSLLFSFFGSREGRGREHPLFPLSRLRERARVRATRFDASSLLFFGFLALEASRRKPTHVPVQSRPPSLADELLLLLAQEK
jgi:hypothetical protein